MSAGEQDLTPIFPSVGPQTLNCRAGNRGFDSDAIMLAPIRTRGRCTVANLIVRNIDERIVKALKARAGKRGHSAEAEHREILAAALLKRRKKSFAEVLAAMPAGGVDADFVRQQVDIPRNVFD